MSGSKGKKHKRKKVSKAKPNGDLGTANGAKADHENEVDDLDRDEQDSKTPTETPNSPQKAEADPLHPKINGMSSTTNNNPDLSTDQDIQLESDAKEKSRISEDVSLVNRNTAIVASDTEARLEELQVERTALREEVAQVRRSLEEIREKHEGELGRIREQLADTQGEKEQAETQYRNLLGKVNTIRSQLGERLKADAVGLQ